MSGNIDIHVIAGEKMPRISGNKPGGLMDPSGLFFQGFSIEPFASAAEPGRYERENMVNLMQ